MAVILVKIAPVVLTFLLGMLLRKAGVFNKASADQFLKLFFYVAFPALILFSVPRLDLSLQLIILPLCAMFIVFCTYALAYGIGRRFVLERPTFGVFLLGSVIMNAGFAFPFIYSAYGAKGMAIASLFDFGNALVVLSFVYSLACKYGGDGRLNPAALLRKFLTSPPLLALAVAVLLNLTGMQVPGVGLELLKILGGLVTPLVMLSLGIYFDPRICRTGPLVSVLLIRMLVGLLLGFVCVLVFDLQGLMRVVVLILASAPAGINTLAFSTMENLDKDFAASVVSYASLIGMLLIPLFIALNPPG